MILHIDVEDKDFIVTRTPQPKVDQEGVQRMDKQYRLPLWSTQVAVTDGSGGEIINITTCGERPDLVPGDAAIVENLIAHPWFTHNKGGISYRADDIKAVEP